MKPFLFAIFATLSVLVTHAQCPVYLSDSEAILSDSEGVLWEGEVIDCTKEIVAKTPLSIFPNPCTDYFEVKNAVDTEGYLFNSLGQFIRRVNFQSVVDVSDLPKAIYFLKAGHFAHKIIVQ